MKELIIRCFCDIPEHQAILSYYPEHFARWGKDMCLQVHLCPGPFWRRVIAGIRHILGKRSVYGDFDEIELDVDEVERVIKFMEEFLKEKAND